MMVSEASSDQPLLRGVVRYPLIPEDVTQRKDFLTPAFIAEGLSQQLFNSRTKVSCKLSCLKAPCSCTVDAWAFEGLPYRTFGIYICHTLSLWAATRCSVPAERRFARWLAVVRHETNPSERVYLSLRSHTQRVQVSL